MTLTVTDRAGYAITRSQTVTVANVAPTPVIGNTTTTINVGQTYNPSARFTDPGTNDGIFRVVVAWGDGTSLSGSYTTQQTSAIRASKVYATGGTYTVRFTVTDKDGASTTVERTITVIAPAT